jgi:hypothetical protein
MGSSRSTPLAIYVRPQDRLAVRLLPTQCHAAVKSTLGDVLLLMLGADHRQKLRTIMDRNPG